MRETPPRKFRQKSPSIRTAQRLCLVGANTCSTYDTIYHSSQAGQQENHTWKRAAHLVPDTSKTAGANTYSTYDTIYHSSQAGHQEIIHGNDLLKSDLAWEARESCFITNLSAASEILRLQNQADIYAKKTEQARVFSLRPCLLYTSPSPRD